MVHLQSVRGVYDLGGEDYKKFRFVLDEAYNFFHIHGYSFLDLPIFEFTDVFTRSLGDASDVVSKEMYSFKDRSDNSITLRPEFTASVVRHVITNNLLHNLPLFLATFGPVFRYERPQKCRQRQFNQISCEIIGGASYQYDVDLIRSARHFLDHIGIGDSVKLHVNSLGSRDDFAAYAAKLVDYFSRFESELSADSVMRLRKNPLRILDSKDEGDKKIVADAPVIVESLSTESREFFDGVLSGLTDSGVEFVVDERLVRGLDYYTDSVFEFVTDQLGAQGTVLGGGRYNGLFNLMGGVDVPALGFAAGIERIISLLDDKVVSSSTPRVAILALHESASGVIAKMRQAFFEDKLESVIIAERNVTKALKKANRVGAGVVVMVGEQEIDTNMFTVKFMDSGTQHRLPISEISATIKRA